MSDFLSFRRMITPTVIQAAFWVGVVVSVVVGLALIGQGQPGGWLVVLLGPLAVRIYCEIVILFFRINETLTDIRNDLRPNIKPGEPAEKVETRPSWTIKGL